MKRWLLVILIAEFTMFGGRGAGPEILELSANGRLSFTNTLPGALYRLEWTGSLTQGWRRMPALLSLEALMPTGAVVTVDVPTLFRVVAETNRAVWAEGAWRYRGFDTNGDLVVVGWLGLEAGEAGAVTGHWTLGYARSEGTIAEGEVGPQVGEGQAHGGVHGLALWLDLNPGWADNNVFLEGTLGSNRIDGAWSWSGFFGPLHEGRFEATRFWESP